MSDPTNGAKSENGLGEGEAPTRSESDRVAELEAANADLRDRVEELESIVEDIAPGAGSKPGRQQADDQGVSDGDTPAVLPSGGQAHKVMGKFDDPNAGVGVYGHNTAGSGTTYGIWGEVDSPNGFGLYTPNQAKVDGDFKTNGDMYMDPDGTNDFTDIKMGSTGRIFYNPDFGGVSIVGTTDSDEFRHTGTGGIVVEQSGAYLKFADGSEQRTAGPVAKGVVGSGGSLVNGVGITAVNYGTSPNKNYAIEFSTIDYNNDDYVAMVTPLSFAVVDTGQCCDPGKLVIEFKDLTGSFIKTEFHVAVFEATSGAATQSTTTTTQESTTTTSSVPDGE